MKVAVVGSSGYIADFLLKRFSSMPNIESILKIDKTDDADAYLDLAEAQKFDYAVLDEIDYAVFTAAVSGPDQCASNFELCWKINVTGTTHFIRAAMERHCRVLFFSSDAVFGDIPGKIYDELSETRAETAYGRMKKAVEDSLKGEPYFKAIRLSYVVSHRDRFVSYCLSCIRNKSKADVFHPFYRNCIIVDDVVDVAAWFAEHWDEYEPFVLNVAGNELVSRVRIADEINRCMGNTLQYEISAPSAEFYQNRPPITQMKSLYLAPYQILPNNTFTEKMQYALEELIK